MKTHAKKLRRDSNATMVFSYGCPRSGTTFLERMLERGIGYHHQKIGEGDKVHPCQSDDGILAVAQLFRRHQVVFVRIVRDPVDVVESFYSARFAWEEHGHIGRLEGMFGGIEGLAGAADTCIENFIAPERINTQKQLPKLKEWIEIDAFKHEPGFVELQYEHLGDKQYQAKASHRIASYLPHSKDNENIFRAFLSTRWNKKPVRDGRLSRGIKESHIPESKKDDILTALSELP